MAKQQNLLMWEITPPPGVQMQQWQTGMRLLFHRDRLDEMLMWLDLEVQNIKRTMEQGLFYNQQPQSQAVAQAYHSHNPQSSRQGKPRPEGLHATHSAMQRRREPRRGSDDAADPDSPPTPKRANPKINSGNVQRADGPMPTMSPAMAKPIPGKKPDESEESELERLRRENAELRGKTQPQGTNEKADTPAKPIQSETEEQTADSPLPAAESETGEEPTEPDLTGPRIHRHRWSGGRYVLGDTCVKCETECTGTEELCPVP